MPSVILLTGLFVVLKPSESAELPLLVLGWCSMLYGVVELVNALKIHHVRKAAETAVVTEVQEVQEFQEVKEEASDQVAEAIEVTDDDAGASDVGDDALDVGSQDVDTGLVVAPRGDD
jgi:hypothetical protein